MGLLSTRASFKPLPSCHVEPAVERSVLHLGGAERGGPAAVDMDNLSLTFLRKHA